MAEGRSQSDEECTSTHCQHAVLTPAHRLSQPCCQSDAFLCCTTTGAESKRCTLVLIHHHVHTGRCVLLWPGSAALLGRGAVGFLPYGGGCVLLEGLDATVGSERQ